MGRDARHDGRRRIRLEELTMTDEALSTLPRKAKGRAAPSPPLTGKLKAVVDAVAAWPDIETTTYWRFDQSNRVAAHRAWAAP